MGQDIDTIKPDRAKILLIGPPGSGKTDNIASLGLLPYVNTMWVASFDGGLSTLRAARKRMGITSEKCKVSYEIYIEDDRTCPTQYKKFLKDLDQAIKDKHDAIVLDGFGLLSTYCFWDVVAVNNLVDKKYGDTSYHLYRLLMDKLSDVITKAIKSSKVVVATCHPDWEKDENTGEVFVFPDVQGKATRQALNIWFDEIYYTMTSADKDGNTVFELKTKPDGKYMAKSRWGGSILQSLEKRNIGQIVRAIWDFYEVEPVQPAVEGVKI